MKNFGIRTKTKTNIEILEQVRAEQKSIYALENMLGYHINELEELRPHKRNVEYIAESNYNEQPDLVDLAHWVGRVTNIETSIKKNEKIIIKIYDRLYTRIILKMMEGEELKPLDIFFYHSKKYIEQIRSGKMTFRELVEHYDWEAERFNNLD